MRIELFRMERAQCLYENEVDFNLSESGVKPLRLDEILEGEDPGKFLSLSLRYPESDGSEELRSRIAGFHGADPDEVLVTNGGSEANYTAMWGLLDKGDRVALMQPNYQQAWGLARAYAGSVDTFDLVERAGDDGARRWALDVDGLERAVTRKTRLIVVTNPNNPTGAVLTASEMDAVVRVARKVRAWLLVDEIYRGAEVNAPMGPSFWRRYDKVVITSGLSKAFGLPGLRIGWIVASAKTIAALRRYRDYTTLTPSLLSDRLARIVLEPARRDRVLARTGSIIRANLPPVEAWIRSHGKVLDHIAPVAGAIVFIKYRLPIGSTALFDRLRDERSVLITPGSHFGAGKYFRVGFGYDVAYTLKGLARIDKTLARIA